MANVLQSFGSRAAFPSAANLNSLATGSVAAIGAVSNTTSLVDGFRVDVNITLPSSGVSATGTIVFFLLQSSDNGTTYTDNLNPAGTGLTIRNAAAVKTLNANANSQVVVESFDLPIPFAPMNWTLAVQNSTGASLASSGNNVSYTPISYTVA